MDPELAFTDVDVLVVGPVVAEISESFDRYWNSELAYPATALLDREPTAEEVRDNLLTFHAKLQNSRSRRGLRVMRSVFH